MTPEIIAFIREHENDDIHKLLLSAQKYPGIDVGFAVDQIIARKSMRDKVPEWYQHEDLIYPSTLSTEQCSSGATARYKQQLMRGNILCDLTGGLGIDSYYFSKVARQVFYVETIQHYQEAAQYNFRILHANNIQCIAGNAYEIASQITADTFYIDPARRTNINKRVFALSDCEPNVLELKSIMLENASRVIIKISPMADISETLRLLPEIQEIHVVAVKNECKEILLVLEKAECSSPVPIHTINITPQSSQTFSFNLQAEREAPVAIATAIDQYLYEPNAAILKSGAFKMLAAHFDLKKLDINSHLYTSDRLVTEFPGRVFRVEKVINFSDKNLKEVHKTLPKANITTRNFPLSVDALRNKSRIKEGGEIYLFATTLNPKRPLLVISRKA